MTKSFPDSPERTRFLIVGGGLAGLLLAWRLREFRPIVLGGTTLSPASDVSAGVLNPVTGGRLTLMEDFAAFASSARELYRAIPGGNQHFHETTIRRYFVNELEIERYEERKQIPHYRAHLGKRLAPGEHGPAGKDPLGSFFIHGVARVEPVPILAAIRRELGDRYWATDADWGSLEESKTGIRLNGIEADSVICCEGVGVVANPFFRWLPFRPVKGETLTVHCPDVPDFAPIIHHEKWIIPLGNKTFRIGSTYRRGSHRKEGVEADPTPPIAQPSEEGRQELLTSFKMIFSLKHAPKILDHRAGTRPCSRDRIPYVGPHPKHPKLLILNGLGSKGALLAPLHSQQLADSLINGDPIPDDINPKRMISRGFIP